MLKIIFNNKVQTKKRKKLINHLIYYKIEKKI